MHQSLWEKKVVDNYDFRFNDISVRTKLNRIDTNFYGSSVTEGLKTPKTIIMIAHSLEILEDFDSIIMLDDGKIVEQWKHNKLMNNHVKYFKLANV